MRQILLHNQARPGRPERYVNLLANPSSPPTGAWLTLKPDSDDYRRLRECCLRRADVANALGQALFAGHLPSYLIATSGDLKAIPSREWGTHRGQRALKTGEIHFVETNPIYDEQVANFSLTHEGRVLVSVEELDGALSAGRFCASGQKSGQGTRQGPENRSAPQSAGAPKPAPRPNSETAEPGAKDKASAQAAKTKRKGGRKPGPYRTHLKKFLVWWDVNHPGGLDGSTMKDIADHYRRRAANDGIKGVPRSRSGLEDAIGTIRARIQQTARQSR